MPLELINATASVVTAVVIGATAIAAIIQLRHMRANNQITALLAVQAEFDAKDFRDAEARMRKEFPEILEDEGFCSYFIAILKDQEAAEDARYDEVRRAARLVANTYENLGVLTKRGIIDRSLVLEAYSFIVVNAWDDLEGFVAMIRAATGERTIYENFEYLAAVSRDRLASQPDEYPRNVKRLNPQLPKSAAKILSG